MDSQGNTLRQRLHAAAAEAMLDSAERAMLKHGFQKATMQQIATEAGCAPGTFYLYFKNKQELFEVILARHMGVLLLRVLAELAKADAVLAKIRLLVQEVVRYSLENVGFFQIMLTVMPQRYSALDDHLRRIGQEKHAELYELMRQLLIEAQRQGLLRDDLPASTLHEFVEFVTFNFVEQYANTPGTQSVEDRMSVLWKLLTGGLGARE